MKSIPLDTSQFRFLVVSEPEPLVDFKTKKPKADRDGQPIYTVDVLASREGHKGEVLTVKVAGAKPTVGEGQKVVVAGLEAFNWETKDDEGNDRRGTSFSATKIEPAPASSGKAA